MALRLVFFYCSWQLMLWLCFCLLFLDLSFGGASTCPFISKGSKVTRKILESVTIIVRTLSLVFPNYKIWSYSSRTYPRELSCRHLIVIWVYADSHGPAESSRSCTLGTYPRLSVFRLSRCRTDRVFIAETKLECIDAESFSRIRQIGAPNRYSPWLTC
jgi:hypothetical protein